MKEVVYRIVRPQQTINESFDMVYSPYKIQLREENKNKKIKLAEELLSWRSWKSAQSPDLNPIEQIWLWMSTKIDSHHFNNRGN